jgi:1-acyl-sn-glycerol-3-phosphate acyltransferase
MYRDFGPPVVPVATNLGLLGRQQEFEKHASHATVEFLDPIPPGLGAANSWRGLRASSRRGPSS